MLEKLLSYTVKQDDCMIWTRCLNTDGYPRMGITGNSNIKVHRLVYELYNNVDATGKVVRHKCDNPKCINPEHLEIGTPADNMRDRDTRDRSGSAKLKIKDVHLIRQLLAQGQYQVKEIAKMFNVGVNTIYFIRLGKTWKHI